MVKRFAWLAVSSLSMIGLSACDNDPVGTTTQRTFTVTVVNVSTPNLVATARAGGTVPLSPGVYAIFKGIDPMFTVGSTADAGIVLIAEDGMNATKASSLATASGVTASGTFDSPGGPDSGPAIFSGESSTFTFTASPGDKLQLAMMFVQSNDWFYAFGNSGLALFTGNSPVTGNVTSQLVLFDAGSEADTAPGTGDFQKPVQTPTATNFGPADPNTLIRLASTSGFTIPATSAVVRVTITSN